MTLLLIFSALTIAVTVTLIWPLQHKKAYALFIALLLPILAVVLYIMLGAPDLPGKPFADRVKDPDFILATMVKETQQKLNQSPSQEGYRHLAEAFYMMKHYAAAAEAYQKAIDLGDNSAMAWAEMGESLVLANGAVTAGARDDFYRALKHDPKDARARFYIGLDEAQKKNYKHAVSIWKGIQKDSPAGAQWSALISKHIELYAKEGGFDAASITPSFPSGR